VSSADLREVMKVVGPILVGQAIVSAAAGVSARLSAKLGPNTQAVDPLIIWLLAGLAAVAINILVYQVTFLSKMEVANICLELLTSALLVSVLALLLAGFYAANWGWMVKLPPTLQWTKRLANIALCFPSLYVLASLWPGSTQPLLENTLRTALIGFTGNSVSILSCGLGTTADWWRGETLSAPGGAAARG